MALCLPGPLTHNALPLLLPLSNSPFQIELRATPSKQPSFPGSLPFFTQARHPAPAVLPIGVVIGVVMRVYLGPLGCEHLLLNLTHREGSANACRCTGRTWKTSPVPNGSQSEVQGQGPGLCSASVPAGSPCRTSVSRDLSSDSSSTPNLRASVSCL